MSHFGAIGHHLSMAIIDEIPHGWVMFSGDMTNDPCAKSIVHHFLQKGHVHRRPREIRWFRRTTSKIWNILWRSSRGLSGCQGVRDWSYQWY